MPHNKRMTRSNGKGVFSLGLTPAEARTLVAAKERHGRSTEADIVRLAMRAWLTTHSPDLLTGDEWSERKRSLHRPYADFDADVRRYVSGEASVADIADGRAWASTATHLRTRAYELGLIQPSITVRDGQARQALTEWLATDGPGPADRRIATVYLKHAHWSGAARELGVSRQRLSQVIQAARGGSMAQRVSDFPNKPSTKIDITVWSDGAVWRLKKGEDFHQDVGAFIARLRMACKTKGLHLVSQRDLESVDHCYVRIVKLSAPDTEPSR